jgi:hypothetical protein
VHQPARERRPVGTPLLPPRTDPFRGRRSCSCLSGRDHMGETEDPPRPPIVRPGPSIATPPRPERPQAGNRLPGWLPPTSPTVGPLVVAQSPLILPCSVPPLLHRRHNAHLNTSFLRTGTDIAKAAPLERYAALHPPPDLARRAPYFFTSATSPFYLGHVTLNMPHWSDLARAGT